MGRNYLGKGWLREWRKSVPAIRRSVEHRKSRTKAIAAGSLRARRGVVYGGLERPS